MDDPQISFIELVALTRIKPESTVERFGSTINSSFFDASNILAGLKQKGLVDFVTAFPSQSTLKLTDLGSKTIAEAEGKAIEPVDALDMALLAQLSRGRRSLIDLGGAVNVAQRDLAMHLFKVSAQQYISYELVNGNMNMYLTEKGFIAVKGFEQAAAPAAASPDAQQAAQAQHQNGSDGELKELEARIMMAKRKRRKAVVALVIVVAIVVVLFLYKGGFL